jgi:hypothetical protein
MPPRTGRDLLEAIETAEPPCEAHFAEHRDMDTEAFSQARLGWLKPFRDDYVSERAKLIAQIEHRRREISTWEDEILGHAAHPALRCYASAITRQFGFRCDCGDGAYDRAVGISALRLSPRVHELIQLTRRCDPPPELRRREQMVMGAPRFSRRINARARAMLHQLLTREQRWSLRARQSFTVVGQDGRTYELTEGQGVKLLVEGEATTSYCIHPTMRLPAHDVMVAQKLLLETNIEHFLATAIARDIRPFRTRVEEALAAPVAAA